MTITASTPAMRKKFREDARASLILRSKPTDTLVEIIESLLEGPTSPDKITVRVWVIKELERRDAEAMLCWLDSDEESPRGFFV